VKTRTPLSLWICYPLLGVCLGLREWQVAACMVVIIVLGEIAANAGREGKS
jgi:hypothetical protein